MARSMFVLAVLSAFAPVVLAQTTYNYPPLVNSGAPGNTLQYLAGNRPIDPSTGAPLAGFAPRALSVAVPTGAIAFAASEVGPPNAEDVVTTYWHDATTEDLVLQLQLYFTATATVADTEAHLNTPSGSFVSIVSTHKPASVSTDVKSVLVKVDNSMGADVTSPSTPAASTTLQWGTLTYQVTFKASAYGTYTIAFDCTQLTTSNPLVGGVSCPSGPSSPSTFTVKIGYQPGMAITRADTVNGAIVNTPVTTQWLALDSTGSPDYTLGITTGFANIAFSTTMVSNTPDSTDMDSPTGAGGDSATRLTSSGFAIAYTAATTTLLSYSLTLTVPGDNDLLLNAGEFVRSDGVANCDTELNVRTGFTPLVSFEDGSNIDTSAAGAGSPTGDFWFSVSGSTGITLVVNGPSALASSGPAYGIAAGNLLAGSSAFPGASVAAGGITSTTVGNAPLVGGTGYEYTLTTSSLVPGFYTFNIPQGVLQLASGPVYNSPLVATLKMGFVPQVTVTTTDTPSVGVTGQSLTIGGQYNFNVLPNSGSAFALSGSSWSTFAADTASSSTFDLTVPGTIPTSMANSYNYSVGDYVLITGTPDVYYICVEAYESAATAVLPSVAGAGGTDNWDVVPLDLTFSSTPATSSATAITYTATMPSAEGPLAVGIAQGSFKRSDGVFNTFASTTVLTGYTPYTAVVNGPRVDIWFSASATNVELLVEGATTSVAATSNLFGSGVTSAAGSMTSASSTPFSASSTYALDTVVTYSGSLYVCTTAITAAADWDPTEWTQVVAFRLTLSNLSPGTYTFTVPQGVVTDSLGNNNAPSTATLKIGFEITFTNSITGSENEWFDASKGFSIIASPGNGYSWDGLTAGRPIFSAATGGNAITDFGSGTSTNTYVITYTPDAQGDHYTTINFGQPTTYIPERPDFYVQQGLLLRNDGVKNALAYYQVKAGWVPTIAGSATTTWFNAAQGGTTTITIATPDSFATAGALVGTPAYSTATGGLFEGQPGLPAETSGGRFGDVSSPVVTTLGASTATYTITLGADVNDGIVAPDRYPFTIAAGVFTAYSGIGNAPASAVLLVGFVPQISVRTTYFNIVSAAPASWSEFINPSRSALYYAISVNIAQYENVTPYIASRTYADGAVVSDAGKLKEWESSSSSFFNHPVSTPLCIASNMALYFEAGGAPPGFTGSFEGSSYVIYEDFSVIYAALTSTPIDVFPAGAPYALGDTVIDEFGVIWTANEFGADASTIPSSASSNWTAKWDVADVAAGFLCSSANPFERVCNAAVPRTFYIGAPVEGSIHAGSANYEGALTPGATVPTGNPLYSYPTLATSVTVEFVLSTPPSVVTSSCGSPTTDQLADAVTTELTFTGANCSLGVYSINIDLETVAPGSYDISLNDNSGVFSVPNARSTVRLIVGFDLQLQIAPAVTTPLTTASTGLVYRRGINGPFITSATTVWLSAFGAYSATPVSFDSAIEKITNAAGQDVTNSVTVLNGYGLASSEAVSTANQLAYQIGIGGLPDGEYTVTFNAPATEDLKESSSGSPTFGVRFNGNGQTMTFIVDRTPPTGVNTIYVGSGPVALGAPAGPLSVPAGMFTDAVSSSRFLEITSTMSVDAHYLKFYDDMAGLDAEGSGHLNLNYTYLSTAAFSLSAPAGPATFTVTVHDEAGNTASAVLTVPIVQPVTTVLSAIDARNVQSLTNLVLKPTALAVGAVSAPAALPYDSNSAHYYVGDFVTYQGSTYECTTEIDPSSAFNPASWKLAISNAPAYVYTASTPTVYAAGDFVTSAGRYYECIASYTSTSILPASNTVNWELIEAASFTINVDFDVPVSGVTASSLVCSISTDGVDALPCTTATPAVTPSSGLSRRFSFTYTIPSSSADYESVVNMPANALSFTLSPTGIKSAAGVAVAAPSAVLVQVDSEAPMPPGTFLPAITATVGSKYTLTLPTTLFSDAFTAAGSIQILSASPASSFGLTFTPGYQGVATISGTPAGVPPTSAAVSNSVMFTLTAVDAAGNVVTATAAVAIKVSPANTPTPVLTLAPGTLSFTEGQAADVFLDAAAAYTGASAINVQSVQVYLINAQYDDVTIGEVSLVASYAPAGTTFNSYVVDKNNKHGVISLESNTVNGLTPTMVQLFVRSVAYQNTRTEVVSGTRTVRVDLVEKLIDPIDSSETLAVIASATRLIKVTAVNNAPAAFWGPPVFASDTNYAVGDVVFSAGTYYECNVAYSSTAGTPPASDLYSGGISVRRRLTGIGGISGHWTAVADVAAGNYNAGDYVVGVVGTSNGWYYICLDAVCTIPTPLPDLDVPPYDTEWAWLDRTSALDFASSTSYAIGDYVKSAGVYYYCIAAYMSNATLPASDASHWVARPLANVGIASSTFNASSYTYGINDFAVSAGIKYRCILGYTSGATLPAALPVNWEVYEGSELMYMESSTGFGVPVSVFHELSISDADDTQMTAASVVISQTNPLGGACDSARDYLALPTSYLAPYAPLVVGYWSAATCTLSLRPTAPTTVLNISDFEAALDAVVYGNLDAENPADGVTTIGVAVLNRLITATVTDNGSNGAFPTKKLSVAATSVLSIVPFDNPPVIDARKAYVGGFLSSTDANANPIALQDNKGLYRALKFPAFVLGPSVTTGTLVTTFTFDLSQVMSQGQAVDGVFAGGAITDVDTYTALANGIDGCNQCVSAEIPFFDPADTYNYGDVVTSLSGGTFQLQSTTALAPGVVPPFAASTAYAVGNIIYGSTVGSSTPDFYVCTVAYTSASPAIPYWTDTAHWNAVPYFSASSTYAVGDLVEGIGANDGEAYVCTTAITVADVWDPTEWTQLEKVPGKWVPLLGLTYTSVFQSDSKLLLTITTTTASSTALSVPFVFTYGDVSTPTSTPTSTIYVDLLTRACMDSDAINAGQTVAGSVNPAYVVALEDAYPDNSLCVYAPVNVDASSTTPTVVAHGSYATNFANMNAAATALYESGASGPVVSAALASQRIAARGGMSVTVPAGSLLGVGSIALEMATPDAPTIVFLRALDAPLGAVGDFGVAQHLTPAGTRFSPDEPVVVCLFVGDTAEGSYRVLYSSSQADKSDPSKGYEPWELLNDQVYNPAMGQVCASTTHFSVIVSFILPIPLPLVVPKAHLMGGSCPNQCSSHGFCRQEGKCACFPDFEGYDCSLRTCPSAETWGSVGETQHSQSECAGRGVCDRSAGQCECFPGYEGASCERLACPNACSGHGSCRLLSELPAVQLADYASWELERVQRCECDGGFTGADCSLRTCPYGDDPETICAYTARQVQRVTLSFETLPSVASTVEPSSDQFALGFSTVSGQTFTTPTVTGFWYGSAVGGTGLGAMELSTALETLPEFAVSGVDVTSAANNLVGEASRSYDVTFSGDLNTGDQALLLCPYNADGETMGCPTSGCMPLFKQMRIFSVEPLNTGVSLSPLAVFQQPAAVAGGNTAETPREWGVSTTLTMTRYATGLLTYKFGTTLIYGSADVDASVPETPVPSDGTSLRTSIKGPHGLLIDFGDDADLSVGFPTLGATQQYAFTFKWRLPTCSVEQFAPAAVDLEQVECANRGVCDRSTGQCVCFNGYSGATCNAQVIYI